MKKEAMDIDRIDDQIVDAQESAQSEALTPVQEKAVAITRARLPHLSAAGLNFEKRTGNFFRATIETQDDGTEKVRRLVVADEDLPAEVADEVTAKRAAATVAGEAATRERLQKDLDEANQRVRDAEQAISEFDADLADAAKIVEAFELPEKAAGRVSAAKKVEEAKAAADRAQAEASRLRAMLLAAGIDPDAA